jgi:broad specificity phosphatase PhoE
MTIRRVLLVRHGETDYNSNGRWQGHLDVPLNAEGEYQAACLAHHLKNTVLDAIYSSDLSRALETARPIAAGRELSIVPDARLREVNLGRFQGLTRSQIAELYPLEHDRWHHDDGFIVPGGESRLQLQARMFAVFQELTTTVAGETIMLVTHGGSIRRLLLQLFSPDALIGKGIDNTSITTLEKNDDAWRLVEFAATAHLKVRHNTDSY